MIKNTLNDLIKMVGKVPDKIICEAYALHLTECKGVIYAKTGDTEDGMCYDKFISDYGDSKVEDWNYSIANDFLTIAIIEDDNNDG